jgi:hypothetical protein
MKLKTIFFNDLTITIFEHIHCLIFCDVNNVEVI